jgi:hypothetical protein
MKKKTLLFACFATCFCSFAAAQAGAKSGTTDLSQLKPSAFVMPVFSEIVLVPYPDGFEAAYEHAQGANYIHEMVPKGETVDRWSQMFTTTGKQGLSSMANLTPEILLARFADGFKRACPETFSARGIGPAKISGHDAFVAWASCGTVNTAGYAHSESTLFLAIKGTQDYYTMQWAERGPASSQPLVYDDAKWGDRLKKLTAVRTCHRVPGEPAPYPSCVDKK